MRGGLERWKRGTASQGVRQATAYAFEGSCDSHLRATSGAEALAHYSDVQGATVTRFVVAGGRIGSDELDAEGLARWVNGDDPLTGDRRGRELSSPDADLLLDGTINAPKSYSLASLLNDDLATEFEALQDRLRERILVLWQSELNARRGAGGKVRQDVARIEVVELQHRRSRALDPHIHRHMWLNVKVLGTDGRWSNVDSRVAMKLHTVVNAEGELAARTDPVWVAALARNGFTIGADGEIEQLREAVRPLSRRSNQIEANRAMFLAEWEQEHPGQEPDRDVLNMIDRRAWAQGRPNKPGHVDEDDWEERTRDELRAINPALLDARAAVAVPSVNIGNVDRDLLAAQALVEADARAASTGGRFSMFDIRACATRAVARAGVVADRSVLDELIGDVVARSGIDAINLLDSEEDVPQHIKQFMAVTTASLKVDLAARFDELNEPGVPVSTDAITDIAGVVLDEGRTLDEGQTAAAAAIAGTDRLVTVTGPAGTGKTTMLKVARAALEAQGRSLIVVAPTKKAASVAGREVGVTASSLHALLVDHGWRFGVDETGAQTWQLLEVGDVDQATGVVYEGPRRTALNPGDRIVVDEAGMVDLHTANALAVVARRTGASLAMVGDHLQAMPVGHSGAMATMKRRSGSVVELTGVHRFKDPTYAALTLKMREPSDHSEALDIAETLRSRGQVKAISDIAAAEEVMVDAFFAWEGKGKRIALVTSTNAEAQSICERIQTRRVESGQLNLHRIAVGQNEQRLLEGDVVQTRRNDRASDVENRALWVIRTIKDDGSVVLASVDDSVDTRTVTADYLAEHVHLAYASTVHGIQGETTDAAIVGPGVDAAGLYVGMTRGRSQNIALAIADDDARAVPVIAETMRRGGQEVSLEDGRSAAQQELDRAARRALDMDDRLAAMTGARWDDRARRPLGTIIDLNRYVQTSQEKVTQLRDVLERASDAIHADQRTLAEARARGAQTEARDHAATVTGDAVDGRASALTLAARRIEVRLETRNAERAEIAGQYWKHVRVLEAAPAEMALRQNQGAALSAMEHDERLKRARSPHASPRTADGGISV